MTVRHRVQAGAIIILLLCAGGGTWALLFCRSNKITRANFFRLVDGMTEAQVEELFGAGGESWIRGGSDFGLVHAAWLGDGVAYLAFDKETGLIQKEWHEDGFSSPTRELFDRVHADMPRRDVTQIFGRPPDVSWQATNGQDTAIWRDFDGDANVIFQETHVRATLWHRLMDMGIEDQRKPFYERLTMSRPFRLFR